MSNTNAASRWKSGDIMDVCGALSAIVANADKAAKEWGSNGYTGADGLLYCAVCNEPLQCRIAIMGQEKTVRCDCRCMAKRAEEEWKKIREQERLAEISRMRVNGFERAEMQNWTFDRDDGNNPELIKAAKNFCARFDTFREHGKGILFSGGVGTGKTYAAACIANWLINKSVPVLMTNFSQIINQLQSSFEHRQEFISGLNSYDLLVIDDFAAERSTEYVNEIVFSVIDARYRAGLPLVVTTNLKKMEITQKSPDIAKERVYSRLREMCVILDVKGTDRRFEKASVNIQKYQRLLEM